MNLGITELQNYIHCPYFYRHKWINNVPLFQVGVWDHWYNCLRAAALDFFKAWIAEKKKPELEYLQQLWQRYWYEDPMSLRWDSVGKKTDKATAGNDGWLVLKQMHDHFDADTTQPAAVEWPFKIVVGDHQLTGQIDIMLYLGPDKILQAIKFAKSSYWATKMNGRNNLELTAWRQALKALSATSEPRLAYYVLENIPKRFINTRRNDLQNEVLMEAVTAVGDVIQAQHFHPNFGWHCLQCDYQHLCDKGKSLEEED